MNRTQTEKPPVRFWNMAAAEGADEATLTFYGEVVHEKPRDWWTGEALDVLCICPEDFLADLETIKSKGTINIKINSTGGDLFTAIAIHNALKALPGKKNVIIEGIAASAASVIAMAGNTVQVFAGSLMMIHGVSGLVLDWVNAEDLKRMSKSYDAMNRAIAAIYAEKTGIAVETLLDMMKRETWMTGAEAVEKGFANEVVKGAEPDMSYSAAQRILIVNGVRHRAEGLHIPERFNIKAATEQAHVVAQVEDTAPNKPNRRQEPMTIQEVRAQFPDIVAQIEKEAVEADRARIKEIEEIQNTIGDAELIASAKFTNPTTAEKLALAAMKKQAALGQTFIQNRADETKPADGVQGVQPPATDPETLKEQEKATESEEIKNLVDTFKNIYYK